MLDFLPDDLIFYLVINFISIPDLENFKLVNKRIAQIYMDIINDPHLKSHFIKTRNRQYYVVKGTTLRWGLETVGIKTVTKSIYFNGRKKGKWNQYKDDILIQRGDIINERMKE